MHSDGCRGAPGRRLAALLAGALAAALAGAVPATARGDGLAAAIRQDLAGPQPAVLAGAEPLYLPAGLDAAYAARGDRAGWVGAGGPTPAAQAMLRAVRSSSADGLEPADYHLRPLERLLATNFATLPETERTHRLAALDLLLSDAFLRLADDQATGRVDPADFAPAALPANGGIVRRLEAVLDGAAPERAIRSLAPQDDGYRELRAALARYRGLAAVGFPPPVVPGPALKEGARGPRVAALAARLRATGDLAAGAGGDLFDAAMDTAVRRFQARHGLAVDGVAGPATLAAVDEPPGYWIDKLRVNLERQRWLPREQAPDRVVVNIADFRVTLFENGQPVLSERAIVGRRYQQTPEFADRIRYLVVDPSWEVPPSIATRELLPAVQRDPGYLDSHGYQVLAGWGAGERRIDPASIDWKKLSAATLPYHFRQPPGPDNPLGRVKFMFPNPYDVYMHDTPARALFGATRRTFSHGCIRVQHAMRLAAALLRLDGRANPGLLLTEAAARGTTTRIDLSKPIPIYVVYMTAWADPSGMLQFRPDIYGRDARVLAALAAPPRAGS